ncbi:MAG: phage tail tape measure protein [Oscillospiraceae bacterium]|nr:phage tail tape measure protein [Oscillospiraceae bacterium]
MRMAGKNKVLQTVVSFAGTVDPSLGKALEDVSGRLEKVNWKAVAVGGAVGGIAVATGKAVFEAGKYLTNLGDEWNSTMNQLAASTGVTGDELAALGDTVKDIYAKGLGEDFQDVADGLAATQKVTDLTGEALEEATAAGFALRDTFDYDISESARTAAALMKNFNISAEEAYGLIATGAQNGADKNGDLLDTLNEYSGQFAALGLSADQFVGSLINGADAGMFSIDKVGDAVKEFNIRAKDGSDTSREAFKSLGLNANAMFKAFAAGGESANAAFFDTIEALNAIEDPLLKNQIGVSLFGTQFEDLEAGVLPVLADIETAAYDGADALNKINEVKYDDLGSAFEQIKRTGEVALLPMASMIANVLTDLAPIIKDSLESIIPIISETTEACMPFVEEFLIGAGEVLRDVLPLITKLASGLLPVLFSLISTLLPPLLELADQLIPPLMEIVNAILPPIASILSTVLPLLTQIASSILPIVVKLIPVLLPMFQPIIDALGPIANLLGVIVGWIADVVGWVADGLGWVVDLFTGNAKAPEGYATGGFTSGPSIAGEDPNYPTEAVISFNPAYRSENLAYWARAGRMLGASTESDYELMSGNTGTSVVYDLSGLSFSPQIKIEGDTDEDALIRKLKELEPEFIDFVLEALNRREGGTYVTADNRLY